MRNILFLRETSVNIGGIEGQIIRIAKELSCRRIFNPMLATSDRNSTFAQEFTKMGFPVFEVPMSKSKIFKGAKEIEKILIKYNNIILIQCHMFRESLIARIVRRKHSNIKHIFRVHTYIDRAFISKQKKYFYHLLDRLTSKYIDRYIANGKTISKEIVVHSWINPNKVNIVWDGVRQIEIPDSYCNELDETFPAKVAMVANLIPNKGHNVLMKALSILKERKILINVRLIGGEGTGDPRINKYTFTKKLKKDAEILGVSKQIEFYGYTQNIYKSLEGFPVLVLPSNREGIPNSILEAMSIRKLVVVSRVGGVPEIIKDRVNGFLHLPGDAKSLAKILEEIFTRPAKTWDAIRNAGYKTWKEKFSQKQMMNELIKIYEELNLLG